MLFYFAYISTNSDFYAIKVAPLERYWRALSNEIYIDLSNNVLYNAIIMIDEVRNQSFIMGWTSCHWPVTLVDVRGKKIQTQKAFDYKKLDSQLQNLLLCQHSFRVTVKIWMVAVLLFVTSFLLNCYALYLCFSYQ